METQINSYQEIIEKLQTIITNELDLNVNRSDITEEIELTEGGLGLDSIAIVNLIVKIEEAFNFKFREEEITMVLFKNIKDLSNFIVKKIN